VMVGMRETWKREWLEKIEWKKSSIGESMIILCSSFDQVVKTKLAHGGKVLHFPMLNSTYFFLSLLHHGSKKSNTLWSECCSLRINLQLILSCIHSFIYVFLSLSSWLFDSFES
jgi:hypothetical protein